MKCSRCKLNESRPGQRYCSDCVAAAMRESRARARAARTPEQIEAAAQRATERRAAGQRRRQDEFRQAMGERPKSVKHHHLSERDRQEIEWQRYEEELEVQAQTTADNLAEFDLMLESNDARDLGLGVMAAAAGIAPVTGARRAKGYHTARRDENTSSGQLTRREARQLVGWARGR